MVSIGLIDIHRGQIPRITFITQNAMLQHFEYHSRQTIQASLYPLVPRHTHEIWKC